MRESKMVSFHTNQKLNLMILSLGIIVSTHVAGAIAITEADCGVPIVGRDTTFVLESHVICNDGNGFSLQLTGAGDKFFSQGNSIIAGNSLSNTGILITNNENNMIETGTAEGFNFDNILIEHASFNHVSKLHINNGGGDGVRITANGETERAADNTIYHNSIQDVSGNGIDVDSTFGGSADGNYLYDNSIDTQEYRIDKEIKAGISTLRGKVESGETPIAFSTVSLYSVELHQSSEQVFYPHVLTTTQTNAEGFF